jgi:hypothetical protein
MTKMKRKNGSNISPCIISQVKYELGLKKVKPINNKKCSNEYWNEIVKIIAEHNSVSKEKYNSILR